MNILFIVEYFLPHVGGAEILFDNLTKWLVEKGHNVQIVTTHFSKDLAQQETLSDGRKIYRIGTNRYSFMFHALRTPKSLLRSADIIHTTTYNAAIPARILAKIYGKKIVITVHEIFGQLRYHFFWWKWFFYKMFEALIFLFPFDKYLCVSTYTKNCLRVHMGIRDQKLVTTYLWIDYDIWNKNNFKKENIQNVRTMLWIQGSYSVLFFGRAWISKGLEFLIRAIPYVVKEIPNFKAVFLVSESKNNPNRKMKNLAKKLGVEKYIIWHPSVRYTQLGEYILGVDTVVVPSLAEGFGFAAAEVCALDQQLVVSLVSSLPEVVSGKINFAEPSQAQSIADGILAFYTWKYDTITYKQFDWKNHVEKTLSIYEQVV